MNSRNFRNICIVAFSGSCLFALAKSTIINGSVTSDYPAIRKLLTLRGDKIGLCTTQKIGDKTFLTAAHCVVNDQGQGVERIAIPCDDRGAQSLVARVQRVTVHPEFLAALRSGRRAGAKADLAIMEAEEPVGCNIPHIRVATRPPSRGEEIQVVGYGDTSISEDATGSGTKRVGKNKIFEVKPNGVIVIVSYATDTPSERRMGFFPVNTAGRSSGPAHGDSGGPMIRDGILIGVVSQGGATRLPTPSHAAFAEYADLTSELSRRFLSDAVAAGMDVRYE